jgi:hypothetical protein
MTWDDVAESYANLGWGWEGRGVRSAPIAGIAVIADIARDRKSKTLKHKGHEEREGTTVQPCHRRLITVIGERRPTTEALRR